MIQMMEWVDKGVKTVVVTTFHMYQSMEKICKGPKQNIYRWNNECLKWGMLDGSDTKLRMWIVSELGWSAERPAGVRELLGGMGKATHIGVGYRVWEAKAVK